MNIKHMLAAATCGAVGLAGAAAFAQQAARPAPRPPIPVQPQSPAQAAAVQNNANESRRPNNATEVPAFPGQTRAPVDQKGVQFTQTVWAKGLDHPWRCSFYPTAAVW